MGHLASSVQDINRFSHVILSCVHGHMCDVKVVPCFSCTCTCMWMSHGCSEVRN